MKRKDFVNIWRYRGIYRLIYVTIDLQYYFIRKKLQ